MKIERLVFGCVHPKLRLPANTVNVYMLDLPQGRVLVDAGPPWTGPVLVKELRQRDWQPDFIALTHSHVDHAGGASAVQAAFPKARLLAHPDDWRILEEGQVLVPTVIDPWTRIRPVVNWAFTRRPMPSCRPHGSLSELEALGITLLATPGHAYPHTSLILPDGQALAGDAFTVSLRGKPQINVYLENRIEMIESMALLGEAASGLLHPGHGPACSPQDLQRLVARLAGEPKRMSA